MSLGATSTGGLCSGAGETAEDKMNTDDEILRFVVDSSESVWSRFLL